MASMLEALKKAKLIDNKKAQKVEEEKRAKLKKEEARNDHHFFRAFADEFELKQQEKHLKRAARETTKSASRVGTKQYFDRFK